MATPANAAVKEPTREELLARIAVLEKLQKTRTTNGFKVGEKGGVSVYGFGKHPVTLYLSQWETFMEVCGPDYANLKAFIEANRSKLSVKPE